MLTVDWKFISSFSFRNKPLNLSQREGFCWLYKENVAFVCLFICISLFTLYKIISTLRHQMQMQTYLSEQLTAKNSSQSFRYSIQQKDLSLVLLKPDQSNYNESVELSMHCKAIFIVSRSQMKKEESFILLANNMDIYWILCFVENLKTLIFWYPRNC